MKKIFRRNQIIITLFAIMIAIAGYINYMDNGENTTETNASINSSENELINIDSNDIDVDDTSLMEPGAVVMTSVQTTGSNMISEVKINREQLRANNKETLYQIIDNVNLDEASKQAAINEMIEMTNISEKEMAAELLLEAKGYGECIVTIVEDSVDVVVNLNELSDTQRAQIEDIVKRKTDCEADKIVISPINNLQ